MIKTDYQLNKELTLPQIELRQLDEYVTLIERAKEFMTETVRDLAFAFDLIKEAGLETRLGLYDIPHEAFSELGEMSVDLGSLAYYLQCRKDEIRHKNQE